MHEKAEGTAILKGIRSQPAPVDYGYRTLKEHWQ
jgi:hypothetical protein